MREEFCLFNREVMESSKLFELFQEHFLDLRFEAQEAMGVPLHQGDHLDRKSRTAVQLPVQQENWQAGFQQVFDQVFGNLVGFGESGHLQSDFEQKNEYHSSGADEGVLLLLGLEGF